MGIEIKSDVLDICDRIKEIDCGYYIMFNTQVQKFEVHNKNQRQSTYCLTLPYDKLDARAIDYVQKTRIENMERLLAEMEEENQKVQNDCIKKTRDKMLNF